MATINKRVFGTPITGVVRDKLEARQKKITNLDDEGLESIYGNVTDDLVLGGQMQKSKKMKIDHSFIAFKKLKKKIKIL